MCIWWCVFFYFLSSCSTWVVTGIAVYECQVLPGFQSHDPNLSEKDDPTTRELSTTELQIGFRDMSTWCEYHCNSMTLNYHSLCSERCLCNYMVSPSSEEKISTLLHDKNQSVYLSSLKDKRNLKQTARGPVKEFNFLHCGDVQWNLSVSGKSPFHQFWRYFSNARDEVLRRKDSKKAICSLSLLHSAFNESTLRNDSNHQENAVHPYMVKFAPQQTFECAVSVTRITGTSKLPYIDTGKSGDLILLHLTKNIAEEINRLNCVLYVSSTPPTIKLTPLARCARNLEDKEINSGPQLSIKITPEADIQMVQKELNEKIEHLTSIQNVIQITDAKTLLMQAISNFKIWAIALSQVIEHSDVEWVDCDLVLESFAPAEIPTSIPFPLSASTSPRITRELLTIKNFTFSQKQSSLSPFTMNSENKKSSKQINRLDDFIADVLGVKGAQSAGINGEGIVVGITDTGLYIDHDQFDQTSRKIYDNLDLSARKVVHYNTFGDQVDQSLTVTCGHGTHVSGIVAGASNSGGKNIGIAFGAKIAFMDIGTQRATCAGQSACAVDLKTPTSADELFSSQIQAGAKIFSYSWGTYQSDYNAQAKAIDEFLYSNPEIIVLVAVGNEGQGGTGTVGSPAGAKNVISVGATLNSAESFASTISCPSVYNENSIAFFSSVGPTTDGRLKPDLVAPGMVIVSSKSRPPGDKTKTSELCNLQGTSQSTPAAAGVAILLYQWLNEGWWKTGMKNHNFAMKVVPSALIKALMIHSSVGVERRLTTLSGTCGILRSSAIDLKYPDMFQGYGRTKLSNIAMFAGEDPFKELVYFIPNNTDVPEIGNGGVHSYQFTLIPDQILRITLVWTDPAGTVLSGKQLQHDLDLSVVHPESGKTFYPITTKTEPDRVNNVEMVQVAYSDIPMTKVNSSTWNNNNNGTNQSNLGLSLTAIIKGFRVTNRLQPYALVASAGSLGASRDNGDVNTTNDIWKSWMTYALIAVGLIIGSCILCYVFDYRPRSSTQEDIYFDHRIAQLVVQQDCNPNNNNNNNNNMGSQELQIYPNDLSQQQQLQLQQLQQQQQLQQTPFYPNHDVSCDRCPFCLYSTSDPVDLVHHVETLHHQASTRN